MDQIDSVILERGRKAEAELERLSDGNSPQSNGSLKEAVGEIVRLRDQLIVAKRGGALCGEELYRTNAILSSVFGLEFPISEAQWTRICEARDALKDMLCRRQARADPSV